MKKLVLASTLLTLLSSAAPAEVTAFNLVLDAGQDYTVPAGKTLILSHAFYTGVIEGTLGGLQVFLNGATSTQYIALASFGHTQNTTGAQPLYLEEGTRLENANSARGIAVVGRLADPTDLFASAEPSLGDVASTAGSLSVTARAATSRPARVTAERSDDLKTWTPVPASSIARTGTDSYLITVARVAGLPQEFLRAIVAIRPSG